MKNNLNLVLVTLIISLSTMGSSAFAQKSENDQKSEIRKIVVFTDRAMIMKETTINLKKGENTIRIPKLSPYLVDQSIQVDLEGATDKRVTEVMVEESNILVNERPEIVKLQTELDQVNKEITECTDLKSAISSSNDFLKRVNPFPSNVKVTTADMEAHTRYLEKSLTANSSRMADMDKKIKELSDKKVILEKQLGGLSPNRNKYKTIVIQVVSMNEKSGVKLSYSYITEQCGWSPEHEARTEFATSKVNFTTYASIYQSTGEDWSNVSMEVSTSKASTQGTTPKLTGWYVDIREPRPMVKSMAYAEEMPRSAAKSAFEQLSEVSLAAPAVQEETTSFTFALPRKVDILSDGKPHRISLATAEANAKIAWFTIPKIKESAFMKVQVNNPFQFPLLAGQLTSFFDQKMVGNSYMDLPVQANEEMNLSMGIDEGIKIERKTEKNFTEYEGLLNKEAKSHYEYLITLTNSKSKPVEIELNDQFPISRNEKIKVEMIEPKGGDAEINDEGIITWKIKLNAGEKKKIPVKFNITYPKGARISGL